VDLSDPFAPKWPDLSAAELEAHAPESVGRTGVSVPELDDGEHCRRGRRCSTRSHLANHGQLRREALPQTNGKVERFHRILLEEWAYIRPWRTDRQRALAYAGFIHFYNHHRSHGALSWATPIATLNRLTGDNLAALHN
jgi:hypothetical protein